MTLAEVLREKQKLIEEIANRLDAWAQNEEMIDQHYTQHGRDCQGAAIVLRAADVFLDKEIAKLFVDKVKT